MANKLVETILKEILLLLCKDEKKSMGRQSLSEQLVEAIRRTNILSYNS